MNVDVRWINVPSYKEDEIRPIIAKEANRLERHFRETGPMSVQLRQEGERYRARVHVQAMGRDWWVTGEGDTLGQGLSDAFAALTRKVNEFKRYTKDRINKRFKRPDPLVIF